MCPFLLIDLDSTAVLYATNQRCQNRRLMATCAAVRMYCVAARARGGARDEKGPAERHVGCLHGQAGPTDGLPGIPGTGPERAHEWSWADQWRGKSTDGI